VGKTLNRIYQIIFQFDSRALAFSLGEIVSVKVRIDGGKWMDLYNVEGPLYVLKWNPKKYFSGLHTIELQVKDAHGRENSYSQPFVLDDTRLSFSLLSRIALMTDASTIVCTFRQTGQNN
jgi:hypothetical protein